MREGMFARAIEIAREIVEITLLCVAAYMLALDRSADAALLAVFAIFIRLGYIERRILALRTHLQSRHDADRR